MHHYPLFFAKTLRFLSNILNFYHKNLFLTLAYAPYFQPKIQSLTSVRKMAPKNAKNFDNFRYFVWNETYLSNINKKKHLPFWVSALKWIVDQLGLEPRTSRLWVCCSNQLSYKSSERGCILLSCAKVILSAANSK